MSETHTGTTATGLEHMQSALAEFQRAGAWFVGMTNPAFMHTMAEMNAELAAFVSERLREDLKTQAEILHCTDPVALREIQCRYLKTAFDQYCAEMGRLVRMNQAALDEWSGHSTES